MRMASFSRMKNIFSFGTVLLALTAAALEPGGVSVDLSGLKGGADAGREAVNLLKGGDFEADDVFGSKTSPWQGGSYVWSAGLKDKAHRQRIIAAHQRFIDAKGGVNGSRCAVILTPEKLTAEQNKEGNPWMSSSFSQKIALPDSAVPVKFALIFQTKGSTAKAAGINSLRVFAHFYNQSSGSWKTLKTTRQMINHAVMLPKEYEVRALTFTAPPHTRRLDISFTLYGQGKVFLDDVRLVKIETKEGINAYVTPWSFLDNTYCIGEKQPGTIVFEMQNERGFRCKNLLLTLNVPAGFKVHSGNVKNVLVSEKKNPDNSTTAVFNIQQFASGIRKDGYGMWTAPSVTLLPEKGKSDQRYPLTYQLSDGNWKGEVKTLFLKVIDPLQGKRPKHFITGIQLVHEFNLPAEKITCIRDFLDKAGLNAIHGGSELLKKSVKPIGIARYSQPFLLCNGYRIGGPKNRTEESYFRQIDGKPFKRSVVKTCPVEVYKRGKFYRTEVLGMLEDLLVKYDTADQIMPNWEPYYLDFKGCFCDRCREEFITFSKGRIKAEEIRSRWPRQIIDSYKNDWIKFRSHQHGRLCVTLEKDINALGQKAGKDAHFIPEIAWSQLVESEKKSFGQYSPLDYMEELPWIDPWGPYIFSSFTEKYTYYPGIHLITYTAADSNKAFVRRHIKNPARRPKLIALPHGFQCGTWVTEPEAFAFETLCFFLQGWEGSFGYYFPKGYDHRYWNALAQANKIIADHEQIVMKGREVKNVSFKLQTPVPAPFFPVYWSEGGNFKKRLPGLENAQIVQLKAFRSGKETVAALGNFWQKGEIFAKLFVKDLDKKALYTVNSSAGYSLGVFSGEQLAKGLLVHTGALRWNFFTILPGRQIKGKVISQKSIADTMEKRKDSISKAIEWEKAYSRKMRDEESSDTPVNDFKAVYELNNANVALKAVKENGRDYLQLTSPRYRALLDPGAGARLSSLRLDGKELVHSLGFGADGFWSPKKVTFNVEKGFKITAMEKSGNGIRVDLTRTIGAREKSVLAGMNIVKSWLFKADGITVTSVLTNTATVPVSFAFRFHNIPNHLAGNAGKVFFGSSSFIREQSLKIARFGKAEPQIDTLFKVNQFIKAPVSSFVLRSANLPDVKLSMSGTPAYGVIFWDGGTFSTMEPVFTPVTLAPGSKADFSMSWKF